MFPIAAFAGLLFVGSITPGTSDVPVNMHKYTCGNPPRHMTVRQRNDYFNSCWHHGDGNSFNNVSFKHPDPPPPPKQIPRCEEKGKY